MTSEGMPAWRPTRGPYRYYPRSYPVGPAIVPPEGPAICSFFNEVSDLRTQEEHDANGQLLAASYALSNANALALERLMEIDINHIQAVHVRLLRGNPRIPDDMTVIHQASSVIATVRKILADAT